MGVVTTIIGIMDPTTPMCDPRHHSPARTGVRAIGRPPPPCTPPTPTRFGQVVWVDLGGFGAGRPLVSRGRDAPGQNGSAKGGRGRVYKTADPLFF